MQDRFVGDIGDFGKYGLLRALTGICSKGEPDLTLGVAWYIPDEATIKDTPPGHGHKIEYLFNPKTRGEYRSCDKELFDRLKEIVCGERSLGAVEKSGLLGDRASGEVVFHDEPMQMPEARRRRDTRREWLKGLLSRTKDANIVFLDPDTGLADPEAGRAPKKLSIGTKDAPKYAFMCELDEFLDPKASVVVYQSFGRNDPCESMKDWRNKLCGRHPSREQPRILKFGSRAFIILASQAHAALIDKRLDVMAAPDSPWHNHLKLHCGGSK